MLFISGDAAHYETSDHVIESRVSNVTYSHRVRAYIQLHDNLIETTSNLSRSSWSYNGRD